jgi:outer membrane immunogenic protein
MRNTVIALIAASTLFAGASHADTQTAAGKFYGNVGYNSVSFEIPDLDTDVTLGTLSGRIGYDLTPNFAVEGEGGFGVVGEKIFGVDVKPTGNLGVFAVAKAPIAKNFELLGRIGYINTWIEVSAAGQSEKVDGSNFAYGVGAQYLFDGVNGIRGDVTRLNEDEVNAYTISYVRKF